jgi:hypothetical protein
LNNSNNLAFSWRPRRAKVRALKVDPSLQIANQRLPGRESDRKRRLREQRPVKPDRLGILMLVRLGFMRRLFNLVRF